MTPDRSDAHPSEQALRALNQAALSISGNWALDKTLQLIVEAARQLVHARYAALGVPNEHGVLIEFLTDGISAEEEISIPQRPQGKGLLGALLADGVSIRIPRMQDDARSVGFPANHPPMQSFLGVSIRSGDGILGSLYLTEKIGADEFTEVDQELIEMLAAHAAVAIQNARLYQRVRELAIAEERLRLGMDLHDGVIQTIFAVGLTLESVQAMLATDVAEASGMLGQAIDGLNESNHDIRNFIMDLRPRHFDGDLAAGLARLVREFQANGTVPVEFSASEKLMRSIPGELARAIFFTTQEGLANIARHARASHVTMELARAGEAVELRITDNGRGFTRAAQSQALGHGLQNMRSRAEKLQGEFKIESAPDAGTTLLLRLPLGQTA